MSAEDGTSGDRVQEIMTELFEIVGFQPPDGYEAAGMSVVCHIDPIDEEQPSMAVPVFLFPEPPSLQRMFDAGGAIQEVARQVSQAN